MATKAPAIDFAALLDLPNLQKHLQECAEWLIQMTHEAGFDDAAETVPAQIKANPWGFLADCAQDRARGSNSIAAGAAA